MSLAGIPEALLELRAGKPVIVVDDEARENEGDVILSAELATREWIAWTVRHTSGFLCAPMPNSVADRLELPVMVMDNQDPRGTNYTVTVDAADRISTGISAADRAHTLRILADPESTPAMLNRPGHILPLRAAEGGVRERAGHTEAAVELLTLAGLSPVGVIGEIVADSGEMMRLPELLRFGEAENVPVITIGALIDFMNSDEGKRQCSDTAIVHESSRVHFEVETTVPTVHGPLRMRAYRDTHTGADHVALISGDPGNGALLRVHSECLTGEVFGSLKCECGPQLDSALEQISIEGGIVIYMRGHEGRGIGLVNKFKAYRLQEEGLDTLDANLALGFPADGRDYTAAVGILEDLGIDTVRVITNNPEKLRALTERGITITGQVPLLVGVSADNEHYLETKRDRMGHLLPSQIEQSEQDGADAASSMKGIA